MKRLFFVLITLCFVGSCAASSRIQSEGSMRDYEAVNEVFTELAKRMGVNKYDYQLVLDSLIIGHGLNCDDETRCLFLEEIMMIIEKSFVKKGCFEVDSVVDEIVSEFGDRTESLGISLIPVASAQAEKSKSIFQNPLFWLSAVGVGLFAVFIWKKYLRNDFIGNSMLSPVRRMPRIQAPPIIAPPIIMPRERRERKSGSYGSSGDVIIIDKTEAKDDSADRFMLWQMQRDQAIMQNQVEVMHQREHDNNLREDMRADMRNEMMRQNIMNRDRDRGRARPLIHLGLGIL